MSARAWLPEAQAGVGQVEGGLDAVDRARSGRRVGRGAGNRGGAQREGGARNRLTGDDRGRVEKLVVQPLGVFLPKR